MGDSLEFFEGYNLLEKSFFICAVAGGLGFVISTLTQFMSSGHDFDSSGDGFDSVDHDGTLSDSDVSFKFLSFQGIASFLLITS